MFVSEHFQTFSAMLLTAAWLSSGSDTISDKTLLSEVESCTCFWSPFSDGCHYGFLFFRVEAALEFILCTGFTGLLDASDNVGLDYNKTLVSINLSHLF